MRKACYIFCFVAVIVSVGYCLCKAGEPAVDNDQVDIYELPSAANECGQ